MLAKMLDFLFVPFISVSVNMVLKIHQCSQCEYKAAQKGNLNRHIESIHECKRFQCPHCEHKATEQRYLKTHIKSIHEGLKFPCPHCEYKATVKGNLKVHITAVHDGKKFPCLHCEYKASTKSNLQSHEKSVHDGKNLKTHIISPHKDLIHRSPNNNSEPVNDDIESSDKEKSISDVTTDRLSNNEDDLISDDEEDQQKSVKDASTKDQCYLLCPISSCTYSLRNGDKDLQRKHFVTSHSTMDNIDHLHFLRL